MQNSHTQNPRTKSVRNRVFENPPNQSIHVDSPVYLVGSIATEDPISIFLCTFGTVTDIMGCKLSFILEKCHELSLGQIL